MKPHKSTLVVGPWRLWHVFGSLVLVAPALALLTTLMGTGHTFGPLLQPMVYGLVTLGFMGVVSLFKKKNMLRYFSLGTKNLRSTVLWGLGGGLAHLAVVYLYEALFGFPHVSPEETAELLKLNTGIKTALVFIITTTVVAPLFEELLFRGMLFRGIRDGVANIAQQFVQAKYPKFARWLIRYAVGIALVSSVYAFITIHQTEGASATYMLGYSFMAIIAALVYVKTGSLLAAIITHSVNNAVVMYSNMLAMSTPVPSMLYLLPFLCIPCCVGLTLVFARLLERE